MATKQQMSPGKDGRMFWVVYKYHLILSPVNKWSPLLLLLPRTWTQGTVGRWTGSGVCGWDQPGRGRRGKRLKFLRAGPGTRRSSGPLVSPGAFLCRRARRRSRSQTSTSSRTDRCDLSGFYQCCLYDPSPWGLRQLWSVRKDESRRKWRKKRRWGRKSSQVSCLLRLGTALFWAFEKFL